MPRRSIAAMADLGEQMDESLHSSLGLPFTSSKCRGEIVVCQESKRKVGLEKCDRGLIDITAG